MDPSFQPFVHDTIKVSRDMEGQKYGKKFEDSLTMS